MHSFIEAFNVTLNLFFHMADAGRITYSNKRWMKFVVEHVSMDLSCEQTYESITHETQRKYYYLHTKSLAIVIDLSIYSYIHRYQATYSVLSFHSLSLVNFSSLSSILLFLSSIPLSGIRSLLVWFNFHRSRATIACSTHHILLCFDTIRALPRRKRRRT